MGQSKYKLPLNLTDLLMLSVAARGESSKAILTTGYLTLAKAAGSEKYSEETGSPDRTIKRLHEKGYLRTTGYRPEKAGRGIASHRFIEITPAGREILERVVGALNQEN